jgi:hypothetical protein
MYQLTIYSAKRRCTGGASHTFWLTSSSSLIGVMCDVDSDAENDLRAPERSLHFLGKIVQGSAAETIGLLVELAGEARRSIAGKNGGVGLAISRRVRHMSEELPARRSWMLSWRR